MKNRKFLFVLSSIILSVVIFSGLLCFYHTKRAFAQTSCPANAHLSGESCYCDSSYKPENGQCVPMTESDICPIAHSHLVGEMCHCDDYYKPVNSQCVPMTITEICGTGEHVRREGDHCVCDEGYGFSKGSESKKCVSKIAICILHNGHYNSAIDDCDCNEGYKKNEADTDCVPDPDAAKINTNNGTITQQQKIDINSVDIEIALNDDSESKFSTKELIKASMKKDATEEDKQAVEEQKKSIADSLSLNEDSVELPATEEQAMDLIKEVIEKNVKKDLYEWEIKVQAAEAAGNVKNKKDKKRFDQLKKDEASIEQAIKDNEDALDVMHKQSVEFLLSKESYASNLWLYDKKYQEMPKRDYMKETGGNPGEALASVSVAISAQYELLHKLKDDLRAKKEEKRSLLDTPPKPDLEKKLKDFEKNWYKKTK